MITLNKIHYNVMLDAGQVSESKSKITHFNKKVMRNCENSNFVADEINISAGNDTGINKNYLLYKQK